MILNLELLDGAELVKNCQQTQQNNTQEYMNYQQKLDKISSVTTFSLQQNQQSIPNSPNLYSNHSLFDHTSSNHYAQDNKNQQYFEQNGLELFDNQQSQIQELDYQKMNQKANLGYTQQKSRNYSSYDQLNPNNQIELNRKFQSNGNSNALLQLRADLQQFSQGNQHLNRQNLYYNNNIQSMNNIKSNNQQFQQFQQLLLRQNLQDEEDIFFDQKISETEQQQQQFDSKLFLDDEQEIITKANTDVSISGGTNKFYQINQQKQSNTNQILYSNDRRQGNTQEFSNYSLNNNLQTENYQQFQKPLYPNQFQQSDNISGINCDPNFLNSQSKQHQISSSSLGFAKSKQDKKSKQKHKRKLNTSHVPNNMLNLLTRYLTPIYEQHIQCKFEPKKNYKTHQQFLKLNQCQCPRCSELRLVIEIKYCRQKNLSLFKQLIHKSDRMRILVEDYLVNRVSYILLYKEKTYRCPDTFQGLYKTLHSFLKGSRDPDNFFKLQ